MSEKFYVRVWTMITIGVVLVIGGVTSCNMHIDYRIAKAIEGGTPALEAKAAFGTQVGSSLYITSQLDKLINRDDKEIQ